MRGAEGWGLEEGGRWRTALRDGSLRARRLLGAVVGRWLGVGCMCGLAAPTSRAISTRRLSGPSRGTLLHDHQDVWMRQPRAAPIRLHRCVAMLLTSTQKVEQQRGSGSWHPRPSYSRAWYPPDPCGSGRRGGRCPAPACDPTARPYPSVRAAAATDRGQVGHEATSAHKLTYGHTLQRCCEYGRFRRNPTPCPVLHPSSPLTR